MSGYNSRLYALMLVVTAFVLNFTLTQPIYSLFLTSKGITVIQLGVVLSVQNFIPLVLRIPMSSIIERIGRARISISYLVSVFSLGGTLGSIASGLLTVVFPYSIIFLLGAAINLGALPVIFFIRKKAS